MVKPLYKVRIKWVLSIGSFVNFEESSHIQQITIKMVLNLKVKK